MSTRLNNISQKTIQYFTHF